MEVLNGLGCVALGVFLLGLIALMVAFAIWGAIKFRNMIAMELATIRLGREARAKHKRKGC